MKFLKKSLHLFLCSTSASLSVFITAVLSVMLFASCQSEKETTFVPAAPDYGNGTMWITHSDDETGNGADIFYIVSTWELDWETSGGEVSHYADVWNEGHRKNMGIEISKIREIFGEGNNFYSPFYRHITLNVWMTRDERHITEMLQPSMKDICDAFDYYLENHNNGRPIVLAGFSQGGRAVVELLKHMDDKTAERLVAAYVMGYKVTPDDLAECRRIKPATGADDLGVTICYNSVKDVKYINPVISSPCAFCINPTNWKTDATPGYIGNGENITVTIDKEHNVLVVKGYDGKEYPPVFDFINVGDLHSAEPWLYAPMLKENVSVRVAKWHE